MIKRYVYTGYRIAFDRSSSWSFDNDFARIFNVDTSSLSHSYNHKNNFLILGESPTHVINGSFGSPEKS